MELTSLSEVHDTCVLGYDPLTHAQEHYMKELNKRGALRATPFSAPDDDVVSVERHASDFGLEYAYRRDRQADAGTHCGAHVAISPSTPPKSLDFWHAIEPKVPGRQDKNAVKEMYSLIAKKYVTLYEKLVPVGSKRMTRRQREIRQNACINHFRRRSVEDQEHLIVTWVQQADVSKKMQAMLKGLVVRARLTQARKILSNSNVDRTLASVMMNVPNNASPTFSAGSRLVQNMHSNLACRPIRRCYGKAKHHDKVMQGIDASPILLLCTKWVRRDALPKTWVDHEDRIVHVHERRCA